MTLSATTRNMERDIKEGVRRVERGAKFEVKPKLDTAGMSAQASRAGRDFSSRFSSAGSSGFSSGGGAAGKVFMGAFAGVASAAAFTALAAAGARAYVGTFQSIMETGLDFSRTLNNFQGVTRATAQEMTQIKAAARGLGSDTSLAGTSAKDAALAMTELAKSGFTVRESIDAARGVLQLSTAGQIEAAQAAEMVSTAMNVWGIDASKATQVADDFAAAVLSSSLDMPDLAQAMQAGANAGASFGISMEDTLATLATFAQLGVKGSDAGTLMKTSLLAWQSASEPQAQAMEALNLQLTNSQGKFVGYLEMMQQLEAASKRMTDADFNAAAATLFGTDAFRAAAMTRLDGVGIWQKIRGEITKEGQAAEMAAAQMKNLPGAVEGFKNTLEGLKLTAFDQLETTVANALNGITNSVQSHGPEIIKFFMSITDAALASGQFFVRYAGVWLESIGQMAGGLGNVLGGITRARAAIDRVFGDTENADKLDKEADAAFGWGEQMKRLGQDAQRLDLSKFRDELRTAGAAAANSAAKIGQFNAAVVTANGTKLFGPALPDGTISGVGPAAASLGTGATGSVTSEEASRLGGATINTSILKSLRGSNPSAKLTSGMTDHSKDSGEHPKGKAIDVDPSRENLAWAWANRNKLSMIIYDHPQYVWYNMNGERAEGAAARKIYGAATMAQHRDHIHIAALSEVGGAASSDLGSLLDLSGTGTASSSLGTTGGRVPDWDAIAEKESGGRWDLPYGDRDSTGGLQIRQGTWKDFGGLNYAPTPGQASKEQQIAVAEKILAKQGPEAWAGGKNFVWKTAAESGKEKGAKLVEAFSEGLNEGGREEVDRKLQETSTPAKSSGGGDASSFGSSLVSGMLQALGIGDVFANPLEWPNVKSAMALANWGGGMLRGLMGGGEQGPSGHVPGGFGGGGAALPAIQLPNVAGFLKPISGQPLDTSGAAAHGAAAGAPPGPGPSFVINGNVGMDPRAVTQRFDAAHNQAWRRNMAAVRP